MADDKLHDEIARLETEIEGLTGVIERSRKIDLIAKITIVAGALWVVASTIGAIRFDPVTFVSATAAVIGGIVVFGSNASTSQQAASRIKAAEARRAELIDMIDPRPIGDASDRIPGARSPHTW